MGPDVIAFQRPEVCPDCLATTAPRLSTPSAASIASCSAERTVKWPRLTPLSGNIGALIGRTWPSSDRKWLPRQIS